MLVAIKFLHTLVWIVFVSCTAATPIEGLRHSFGYALTLWGIVTAECLVLAANGGRCPLTDLASRYTEDRSDNFDIYLPLWLARNNKTIFGTLFVGGSLLTLALWLASRS